MCGQTSFRSIAPGGTTRVPQNGGAGTFSTRFAAERPAEAGADHGDGALEKGRGGLGHGPQP